MKILFICGSLEEGRDGVGDYTRRLAAELIRNKQIATIIAINDHFINEIFSGEQDSEGTTINVLRLPPIISMRQRCLLASEFINRVNADWISLQYVSYAFHQKGLPYLFHQQLLKLGGNRPWHIMFHELWIGMELGAPVKQRVWGWLQQQSIKQLIRRRKPQMLHTHTALYQRALSKIGYATQRLSLFSNIPVLRTIPKDIHNGEQQTIPLVLFGGIHYGARVEDFVKKAAAFPSKVELKIIGKKTAETKRWASIWKDAGLSVEEMGEQSPAEVSKTLSASVAGITTTPVALMEKSGSIAAMREHGLPIIALSRSWVAKAHHQSDEEKPFAYLEDFPGDFWNFRSSHRDAVINSQLSEVAATFLKSLTETNVHG